MTSCIGLCNVDGDAVLFPKVSGARAAGLQNILCWGYNQASLLLASWGVPGCQDTHCRRAGAVATAMDAAAGCSNRTLSWPAQLAGILMCWLVSYRKTPLWRKRKLLRACWKKQLEDAFLCCGRSLL